MIFVQAHASGFKEEFVKNTHSTTFFHVRGLKPTLVNLPSLGEQTFENSFMSSRSEILLNLLLFSRFFTF